METKLGAVHIGRNSYGAVSTLSGADAAQLITATSGLIKTVAVTGTVGLGLAGLLVALFNKEPVGARSSPMISLGSSLVRVETEHAKFWGVMLDTEVQFRVFIKQGHWGPDILPVPMKLLSWLQKPSCRSPTICTVDDSHYNSIHIEEPSAFRVCTSVGIQRIKSHQIHSYEFRAAGVAEINGLRDRLTEVLSYNLPAMIDIIGRETFEKFFKVDAVK